MEIRFSKWPLIMLSVLPMLVVGQDEPKPSFIPNEIFVGLNRTTLANDVTNNLNGFAVGFAFNNPNFKNRINLAYSVSFIQTRQFKSLHTVEQYLDYQDAQFQLNNLSFSIGPRQVVVISRWVCAVEAGVFFNANLSNYVKGTRIDRNRNGVTSITEVHHDKVNLDRSNKGLYASFSYEAPLKSTKLIFKAQYRYGLFDLSTNSFSDDILERYLLVSVGFGW